MVERVGDDSDGIVKEEVVPLDVFVALRDELRGRCGMTITQIAEAVGVSDEWMRNVGSDFGSEGVDRVRYHALLALKSVYDGDDKRAQYLAKVDVLCRFGHTKISVARAFAAKFNVSESWFFNACSGQCRITDAYLAFLDDLIAVGGINLEEKDESVLKSLCDICVRLNSIGVTDKKIAEILQRSKEWVSTLRKGIFAKRINKPHELIGRLALLRDFLNQRLNSDLPRLRALLEMTDLPTPSRLHEIFILLRSFGVSYVSIADVLGRTCEWVNSICSDQLPSRVNQPDILRNKLPDLLKLLPKGALESEPGLDA